MFKEFRKFKNAKGLIISAIYEGENRNAPTIVMAHGYGSSKNSQSTVSLAQKLVERGLSVYRFDFTGCGQSQGKIEDLTPLQGLDDLTYAIKNLKKKKIAFYGSSFGGYAALLYVSKHQILALGLKAPVSNYPQVEDRIAEQNYGFTRKKKQQFIEEIENIDIYKNAKNIKCPTLIVHGDRDTIVPLSQSKILLKCLGGRSKLEILKGAGHVMRGEYLQKANTNLANFFVKNLNS